MTAALLWFVRILVIILIIRLVVRWIHSLLGQRQASKPISRMPERAGGTLVRDPQCGTYVPASRALVVGHGDDALHFCSATCRDAWVVAHGKARAKA